MHTNSYSRRLLSTYEISDEIESKLCENGFKCKSEMKAIAESQLQSICGLTDSQMESIREVVIKSDETDFKIISAFDMFGAFGNELIATGSKALDNMLSGGLHVKRLTQLSGEGGSGKTQICMQLCINVQMPQLFGGLSGEALYIDTENNIRPERLRSMAEYCLKRHNLSETLSVDYIISRIHLKSCHTDAQQLVDTISHQLESFIDENPKIRLVVIDSIAHLFRYDYKGVEKDYDLAQIAYHLKRLAYFKKLAILVTNQVSYSCENCYDIPSLGRQWQTVCSTSLLISRTFAGNPRKGILLKALNIDPEYNECFFEVTETGIRNVNEENSALD